MLLEIHPKLPMRDKLITRDFYFNKLGFKPFGSTDYPNYLMIQLDHIQIHFFEFKDLNPKENYGKVYIRTNNLEEFYDKIIKNDVQITEGGKLEIKPWHQKEFSLLDPDNNLLTFGESLI